MKSGETIAVAADAGLLWRTGLDGDQGGLRLRTQQLKAETGGVACKGMAVERFIAREKTSENCLCIVGCFWREEDGTVASMLLDTDGRLRLPLHGRLKRDRRQQLYIGYMEVYPIISVAKGEVLVSKETLHE